MMHEVLSKYLKIESDLKLYSSLNFGISGVWDFCIFKLHNVILAKFVVFYTILSSSRISGNYFINIALSMC